MIRERIQATILLILVPLVPCVRNILASHLYLGLRSRIGGPNGFPDDHVASVHKLFYLPAGSVCGASNRVIEMHVVFPLYAATSATSATSAATGHVP